MNCPCEPVSLREIANRTNTEYETVKAWHYKRAKFATPKLPVPQWPGAGEGPRWCWTHQLTETTR